ncbi:MAG TPA: histidine kinase N-terminal 7TM domain-containing protein [Anaerolineales bacterium]|nr:histidine kinase N-terminal 7TM domain-containing protein [Anaerolineales bacterium]
MDLVIQIHIVILLLVASGQVALAVMAWRRSAPASRAFVWLTLSGAFWTLTEAFETLSFTAEQQIFWSKVGYIGKESLPVLFLFFALEYAYSRQKLGLGWRLLLWVFPVITMLVVMTNDWHGLFWPAYHAVDQYSWLVLVFDHGSWFWITLVHNYTLILAGSVLLLRVAWRSLLIYRRQGLWILAGVAIPLVANAFYIAGLAPLPGLDLTPLAFAISAVAFALSLYRYHLLDLVPVARDLLIETLDDGVVVLDPQERVVDMNPASRLLLSLDDRSLGAPFSQVLPAWQDLPIKSQEEDEITRSEVVVGEYSQRVIEMVVKSLHDRRGKFIGRLLVLNDISQRKQVEKMRDELINTLVHDLRNPLGSVLLALNSLELRADGEADMLMIARHSAESMLGMVNEILDVSRLQVGQMPVRFEALDIRMMIDRVLKLALPLALEKQLNLTTLMDSDLPFARGDYDLVERTLQNLVGNAVKYSPVGGDVTVQAREDKAAQALVVQVTDAGPGIALEIMPHMFELFVTGQGRGKGSGIGLFFCRLAVEAQGGRIWAENAPDGGAILSFSLPVER